MKDEESAYFMSLKFIAISGTTDVTENMYVYEYGEDLIVVDCGVGFPESEMYGVDLVIPDFSYIVENRHKLKGILITHGHEDHFGALPFLIREVSAPIYATKLVAGFIKDKFLEYGEKVAEVRVINPETDTLDIGSFRITPFRVSHSVPDSVGYALDTPEGMIFHIADYKFDWTPVDGRPFDIKKVALLAQGSVLALVSDCLGSTSPGYTKSEREIEKTIEDIVRRTSGQVFFTTISSNISRVQQALNIAERLGRYVSFIGRSVESKALIASDLSYLHYSKQMLVNPKRLRKLPKEERMYIVSGSYGQVGSALYRVALGEHDLVRIEEKDVVIFSGDPAPPGTKDNVDFVVDRLFELNCEVHYYDTQEDLHVSGHGSQEDISMLASIVRPKYFIPIGGTIRHMRAYRDLMVKMGFDGENVFEPLAGGVIEFESGNGIYRGEIPVRDVLVDGLGIGDVGNVVLRDRQKLSQDGIVIVLIQVDRIRGKLIAKPEIISRGFVYSKKMKDLLISSSRNLEKRLKSKKSLNKRSAKDIAIDFLERYFYEKTRRRPMVLPLVVEV